MSDLNPVRMAVHQAGGPTRVAAQLKVSSRAVASWQQRGYVPKRHNAEALAALSYMSLIMLIRP